MGADITSRVAAARERIGPLGVLSAFVIALCLKAALMRFVALGDTSVWRAFLVEGPFFLAVMLLVDWFFADMRIKALMVADAALSVTMLAISVFASYYGQLPSSESLRMVGQATTVGTSIWSLLRWEFVLFFADLLVLGLVSVTSRRLRSDLVAHDEDEFQMQHSLVYAALLPAIAAIAWGMVAVLGLPAPVDGTAVSRSRGVFVYLSSSAVPRAAVTATTVDLSDPSKVQSAIERLKGGSSEARLAEFPAGAFEGKNVIVIQVEALQRLAVGARIDGQPVTPNLDKLVARSWYFPNTFAQVGWGTTSDAEIISNTSLYPSRTAASTIDYAAKVLPGLPRMLADEGYDTTTFHTNDAAYWNRTQLYPALGFKHYYDKSFFGEEDVIAFGSSDKVLFDKTLPELLKRRDAGTPFYAQIVTQSSHFPFTEIPADERTLDLPQPYASTMTGDYLVAVNYADRQLGAFLDELDRTGLADESIVVVYGDHFGLANNPTTADARAQKALGGGSYTQVDRLNIPLIVRLPGQTEGRIVESSAGQIDIMPTIADALGLDISATPHFGRSLFDGDAVLMAGNGFMAPGSYFDEDTLFVPGVSFEDGTVYDVPTRKVDDTPLRSSRTKWDSMRSLIALSDAWVKHLPGRQGYDPSAQVTLPDEQQ